MTLTHADTIREALEDRLVALRRQAHSDPRYSWSLTDWRQQMHRRNLARDIRAVRAALRDLA